MSVLLTAKKRRRVARETRMVELASDRLIGLTLVVFLAFCLACGIKLPSLRKKSSYNLTNRA
jgi:hypothetical protein